MTWNDAYTQDIGRGFIEEYQSLTGQTPYLIVDNLHRSRMDPNRPLDRALGENLVHTILCDINSKCPFKKF